MGISVPRGQLLVALASLVTACDGQARGRAAQSRLPVLDHMLEQLRATASFDVASVEQATGARLHRTDDSTASFDVYEGSGIRSGRHTFTVDLRTPVRGGDATAGALLVLKLSGQCTPREDVEATFGPLQLTDVPRGDSLDEEAYWSRREKWGDLSFGFASRNPGCLSSIVLATGRVR